MLLLCQSTDVGRSDWEGEEEVAATAGKATEEERIDDYLDFEAAKFTNTLRSSRSRPVTETDEEGQDWWTDGWMAPRGLCAKFWLI